MSSISWDVTLKLWMYIPLMTGTAPPVLQGPTCRRCKKIPKAQSQGDSLRKAIAGAAGSV